MFTIAIILFFVIFLFVMGSWQRQLDRREKREVIDKLQEAIHTGSNKAIGQFPLINAFSCIGCSSCIKVCPEDEVIGMVNGIAHVIHGARCVGHGLCEAVCPVGAIKVGLGNTALRPDIPILTVAGETSIPGIFIAGELAGLSLIRNAVDQGSRVVKAIAERLHALPVGRTSGIYDLVIVGAGPAGLAAALQATELKLNYLIISQDELGGTIRKYPRRKLTLVQQFDIPLYGRLKGGEYEKEQLVELWEQIVKRFAISIKTNLGLTTVVSKTGCLEVSTTGGSFNARTVVLAMGRRGTPRKLAVPGEESEKVMYQLLDAGTYSGQNVLVVGGGDSAIEAATALANQTGNVVTISYRKESFFRLKSRNDQRIREYVAQKRLRVIFSSDVTAVEPKAVRLRVEKNGSASPLTIPNDYVFVLVGGEVPYPMLKKMGIRFGGPSDLMAA